MLDRRPLWKRPLGLTLMLTITAGLAAWLALDRPIPDSWLDESGRPALEWPGEFQADDSERVYCAESTDTGTCACIASDGGRPDISDSECRRRARTADTSALQDADG